MTGGGVGSRHSFIYTEILICQHLHVKRISAAIGSGSHGASVIEGLAVMLTFSSQATYSSPSSAATLGNHQLAVAGLKSTNSADTFPIAVPQQRQSCGTHRAHTHSHSHKLWPGCSAPMGPDSNQEEK